MTTDMQDRLWAPLLTHYREAGGTIRPDSERMRAHVGALWPAVSQFLLAGSTGDGWDMDDIMLREIVMLSASDVFADSRILVGAFGRSTPDVVRRAILIEKAIAARPAGGGDFRGLAICPPVDAAADQEAILAHYDAVLRATRCPIAVYELPQLTLCSITPETMRILAAEPRITMFKDTSGVDRIIEGGIPGVVSVRGAEGDFLDALDRLGYDGLLLSTANIFAWPLRRMLGHRDAGRKEEAAAISALLAMTVSALFDVVAPLCFGNVFSNVNRAGDHLLAHGSRWREASLPLTISGRPIPMTTLEQVSDRLLLNNDANGYL